MTPLEFLKHVKVVSEAECAQAEYRVCSIQRNMCGLNEDTCSHCGCLVYYDPRMPVGKQKLVCLLCLNEIARP
jgi:hypothetical protein